MQPPPVTTRRLMTSPNFIFGKLSDERNVANDQLFVEKNSKQRKLTILFVVCMSVATACLFAVGLGIAAYKKARKINNPSPETHKVEKAATRTLSPPKTTPTQETITPLKAAQAKVKELVEQNRVNDESFAWESKIIGEDPSYDNYFHALCGQSGEVAANLLQTIINSMKDSHSEELKLLINSVDKDGRTPFGVAMMFSLKICDILVDSNLMDYNLETQHGDKRFTPKLLIREAFTRFDDIPPNDPQQKIVRLLTQLSLKIDAKIKKLPQ